MYDLFDAGGEHVGNYMEEGLAIAAAIGLAAGWYVVCPDGKTVITG